MFKKPTEDSRRISLEEISDVIDDLIDDKRVTSRSQKELNALLIASSLCNDENLISRIVKDIIFNEYELDYRK